MKRFSATLYLAVALTSTALATVQPAAFAETEAAWLTGKAVEASATEPAR